MVSQLCRAKQTALSNHFVAVTKEDTMMSVWVIRARWETNEKTHKQAHTQNYAYVSIIMLRCNGYVNAVHCGSRTIKLVCVCVRLLYIVLLIAMAVGVCDAGSGKHLRPMNRNPKKREKQKRRKSAKEKRT